MAPSLAQRGSALLFFVTLSLTFQSAARSQEGVSDSVPAPQPIELAGGKLRLPVPADWKRVDPRNRIIQHEFSIAAAPGDTTPGRMTIMAAGGGVEANLARWAGQFQTAGGQPLGEDAQKIEVKKIGALTVHLVDLTGDFQDQPRGPFGPKVNRPNTRMLAAIVPLSEIRPGGGTWFIKLYGPQATIDAAAKSFATMVADLELVP
jgi:hypothetical protein